MTEVIKALEHQFAAFVPGSAAQRQDRLKVFLTRRCRLDRGRAAPGTAADLRE
jgi:hypothetical protein